VHNDARTFSRESYRYPQSLRNFIDISYRLRSTAHSAMKTLMTGINKRFREHDLDIRNKLMREHSDSPATVDDNFNECHRSFLSRPNASRFWNNCRDNEDSDDKMELEDEIADVQDCLQLSTISNDTKSKRNPKIDTKLNMEPIFDYAENSGYDSTFIVKGGKMKYVRKIDFLVDDLIRKTNKTLGWVGGCSDLSCIPSSVGPDPSTDRRFLSGGDRMENAIVVAQQNNCQMENQSDASESRAKKSDYVSPWPRVQKLITKEKLSGDITHDDWPIEEVPITATEING
jgi:hypothetical protein